MTRDPGLDRRAAPDRRLTARGGRREQDYAGRPLVLIVDDHADSRELMAAVLGEIGVVIAEAGTGRDALRRVAGTPQPMLILIDLSLPDCHGADVVRALKSDPETAGIPVVALTAAVLPADKERAASAGCAAFIAKPVLPEDVVNIVRRLLTAAGAW